jgi:hypothetical protein
MNKYRYPFGPPLGVSTEMGGRVLLPPCHRERARSTSAMQDHMLCEPSCLVGGLAPPKIAALKLNVVGHSPSREPGCMLVRWPEL